MFHQPPNQVELRTGKNFARISSLSAALTYLEIDGVVAIAQVTREAIQNAFASVVCAPWPNRIADGIWNDVKFPGNDAHGNALHGLVFDSDFTLTAQSESSATYSFLLEASESYPFDLEITATYLLDDEGIKVSYFAKNVGEGKAPYGVAAHPYFNVNNDSTFSIMATRQFINNAKQIPIGMEPAGKAITDLVYGESHLDDCFTGLTGDVVIQHADGSSVTIWQDAAYKYLMVYTGHHLQDFGFPNPGLAIEPQTCPANAFNSGEDLIWLKPGESWQASWGVTAKGIHV
jgi:aldose 1-epimerase